MDTQVVQFTAETAQRFLFKDLDVKTGNSLYG